MNDNNVILLCIQLCAMLTVAVICTKATDKLGFPSVVGEILAGIILGPTIFGVLFPEYFNYFFPPHDTTSIGRDAIVKLGQIFFLFIVGLEMNLAFLKQQVRSVIAISLFGIMVPFILGAGTVIFFPNIWGSQLCSRNMLAIFIGVAISISALPVIARILIDLKILHSKLGTLILSAATLNDLCGWILFSFVLSNINISQSSTKNIGRVTGLALGLAVLIGIIVFCLKKPKSFTYIKKLLPKNENYLGIITIIVLFAAAIAEYIGIHAVFGAFLIGAVFSLKSGTTSMFNSINKFTNSFFIPIYFVSVGLKTNFISSFDLLLVVVVTLVACIGKIGGAFIGAKLSKIPLRETLIVAFAMNARGAMEIILASIAFENKIIDQRVFVALVLMAIITTLVSGPVIQKLLPGKARNVYMLQSEKGSQRIS